MYKRQLQAQSVEQLQAQLVDAKKELFNLRFQNATNQLDNTARIKEVRKTIARIQTVITANQEIGADASRVFMALQRGVLKAIALFLCDEAEL